ncbi:MAG TPA: thioesterase family protein [Elusimicrobiales bacterium]|nr:thioesterase family protein [Elusimicrobiales bacterium]
MKIHIYYFDTDCGGVVYHANYLKFFEMARTEYMEKRGLSIKDLMDKDTVFVIYKQEVTYKAPVRYGEEIEADARILDTSDVRVEFEQKIKNSDGAITTVAKITLICVDGKFNIKSMSPEIKQALLKKI